MLTSVCFAFLFSTRNERCLKVLMLQKKWLACNVEVIIYDTNKYYRESRWDAELREGGGGGGYRM